MSYYVESDGDRVPKDVYIVDSEHGGRFLTMECESENARFVFARHIAAHLNGMKAKLKNEDKKQLGERAN